MLLRFFYRSLTNVSWRLLYKAAFLWCGKSYFALRAFKKRLKNDIQFPPFLFFSLTDACNLRCRGCWVGGKMPMPARELSFESVDKMICTAQKQSVNFFTLLGGEPFLYPELWKIIEAHPEAYFQIITNGHYLDEEAVSRLKKLGNVSPLVSIDGLEHQNDNRRGEGSFNSAVAGCQELQRQKILFGVATVVTFDNFEEVLTETYVQMFIDQGAMYLWYYIYRPVGSEPATHWALPPKHILEMRKRLLKLRKKMPIILIDTYWDADGYAVCPASKGMAFVIGPQGSIEPCPPLNVAKDFITDNGGDLYAVFNESQFLRRFRRRIEDTYQDNKSQGCLILDQPYELAQFFRLENVNDVSGRDLIRELEEREPKPSHYIPGGEIPENYWVYRLLKKMLFFGMGAYG
ncbi:radical SAM protein [Planctomycetales bacterium]|nr:radical SAM protein [Planctomycetales bacterium]